MRILILSRKFQIYSTRRLVEEITAAGHTPLRWDPSWPVSKCATTFNALIPRFGSFQFEQALESLEEFQNLGGPIINSVEAYRRSRNKWSSYLTFLENNIATAYSELVSQGETRTWSKGFPCIVKELESSKGEGVHLMQSEQQLQSFLSSQNTPLLIQEAFPESFGEDIRVFVVGEKIVACMKRKSTVGFRSNIAQGGVGEPCTLTSAEEELVLRSSAALNLQIAGVDLLRTHKGSLILEANPCPGLEGIEKFTQVNVGRAIIKHIEDIHELHTAQGRTDTHL